MKVHVQSVEIGMETGKILTGELHRELGCECQRALLEEINAKGNCLWAEAPSAAAG
jgi:hypothetical protein